MCFERAFKKTDSLAFEEWKTPHVCQLNHSDFAGNMEPVGAKRIWERRLQKNKLQYTSFYGDSDSKSFSTIKNTYPAIRVQKRECAGHVQKRVGCHLRNLKKQEKGISGKGKLTNTMIERLQKYYGIVIKSNKNNLKGMQSATKAALFHVASNKDHNPVGPDSWCKYNRDRTNGTISYKTGPGLLISIVLKLRPISEEQSNEDLLKKCLHGMTQNQNESFNVMIWSCIPKSTYVSFSQLQLGVYDAVANFNIGRKASILIFEKLNMIPGKYCLEGCRKINEKRLFASKYGNLEATKKRRKIRRGKAKNKDDKIMTKKGNLMKQVHSKT